MVTFAATTAMGAGGASADGPSGRVDWRTSTSLNDPTGDVVVPDVDITKAHLTLGPDPTLAPGWQEIEGLYVTLMTGRMQWPADDEQWTTGIKDVTWHLDTDLDGADDYQLVFTGESFEGNVYQRTYVVRDASGTVTCTGGWLTWFDDPFPYSGYYAEVPRSCIGSATKLQWYVGTVLRDSVKYHYTDRAPDSGWSGPVTYSGTDTPAPVPVPPVPPTGPITPVPPRRVFDSRTDVVLQPGEHRIKIAGVGGVPSDAAAVLLNVTIAAPGSAGYATVYPCQPGGPPQASNLNYAAGTTVAASAFTGVDASGDFCVYVSADTELIVDVNGYIPAGSDVHPIAPSRLLDTRSAPGTPVTEGSITEVVVAGRDGVPADAASAFLNVTAVGPAGSGYLTVFPCGAPVPDASNVNYTAGRDVPNAVLAKLGVDGKICVYSYAATHLIVDVNGYIGSSAANAAAITPFRMVDTRPSGIPVAGATSLPVAVIGRGGVPAEANAVLLNVTVDQPAGDGYLTVYPCGATPPNASNLNFTTHQTVSNAVVALPAADGSICVYASVAAHVLVDATGYVTP